MQQRYELISYSGTNYRFSCGWSHFVTPHLHREFEIGVILGSPLCVMTKNDVFDVSRGEMWLLNPYENHETHRSGDEGYSWFVELQLSPAFFREYYPQIGKIRFDAEHLTQNVLGKEQLRALEVRLLQAACTYFEKEPFYQIACARDINEIFLLLMQSVPYRELDRTQEESARQRNKRIQRINSMIEGRYDQKLLLQDIAQEENVSMYYLSHFFKENWGMSYQDYLLRFRCAKARELLMHSDSGVSDISFLCGFSNPKYNLLFAGRSNLAPSPACGRRRR